MHQKLLALLETLGVLSYKLAFKYHPDKSKGERAAEEKFKDINEANEVLTDPEKRKKCDQFGADWKHYKNAGAQSGGFDWAKYASDRGGQAQRMRPEEFDAMFGGKAQVKALKGRVRVDIQKETPNGTVLKLRGLGMPIHGKKNEFGNLFVKVDIQLPDHLSEQEIGLFGKLAALRGIKKGEIHEKRSGFVD